jgi:hypothetical protein
MAQISGINNEEEKRRAQYIAMRGAQMAMEEAGQEQELRRERPRGSRRQLLGTLGAVVGVLLILGILAYLRII